MRRKTKILLSAAASTIILGYFSWRSSELFLPEVVAPISEADYFFKQVTMHQFDKNGKLLHRIQADKMKHFENQQISMIESPHIVFNDKHQASWQVDALFGNLYHHSNQLELERKVVINVDNTAEQSKIFTEQLVLDMSNKTAATDLAIHIVSERWQTNAIGMLADLNSGNIHLNEQVVTQIKVTLP